MANYGLSITDGTAIQNAKRDNFIIAPDDKLLQIDLKSRAIGAVDIKFNSEPPTATSGVDVLLYTLIHNAGYVPVHFTFYRGPANSGQRELSVLPAQPIIGGTENDQIYTSVTPTLVQFWLNRTSPTSTVHYVGETISLQWLLFARPVATV
ncbi:MAG TPA: hypothetical protein VFL85_01465 [Candidatus Saccharimonadales bacterium]|nr:hypothetical protein [Candidatus Saccharimonadales bacterium]